MKHVVPVCLTLVGVSLTMVGDVFLKRSEILTHPKLLIVGAAFYLAGCVPVALLFKNMDFTWVFIVWESLTVALALVVGSLLFREDLTANKMLALILAVLAVVLSGS